MCALQSKGIVHRDLKPQNLLLSHSEHGSPMPANIRLKIGKLDFVLKITFKIFGFNPLSPKYAFLRIVKCATWSQIRVFAYFAPMSRSKAIFSLGS